MQRLSSAYRTSLVLAATNAGSSFQREAPEEIHGFGLRRRADDRRDVDGHDTHHDVDYRDLSDADYDDQPTYWYWSYDHPDAGI
ncbi:MAG: hypothetical protein WAK94_17435 [Steroidobacteraceae bacterium]